jgi:hypothetical protein
MIIFFKQTVKGGIHVVLTGALPPKKCGFILRIEMFNNSQERANTINGLEIAHSSTLAVFWSWLVEPINFAIELKFRTWRWPALESVLALLIGHRFQPLTKDRYGSIAASGGPRRRVRAPSALQHQSLNVAHYSDGMR